MPKREIPPVHPGEILKHDFMVPFGLSANQLALALQVATNRITHIINGQRSITAETALRLSQYFGTSAEFWMNLQARYDLLMAVEEIGDQIKKSIKPIDPARAASARGGEGAIHAAKGNNVSFKTPPSQRKKHA